MGDTALEIDEAGMESGGLWHLFCDLGQMTEHSEL